MNGAAPQEKEQQQTNDEVGHIMTLRIRSVAVKQLPAKLDARAEKRFLRELESSMNGERPAIVLDCSPMQEMNSAAMHLVLCCLEGALKHNGDVRLSGVSPRARLNLELAGVDRLFRIFSTVQEAVESFQGRAVSMPMYAGVDIAAETAA